MSKAKRAKQAVDALGEVLSKRVAKAVDDLPMDLASQQTRAKAMGFGEKDWFHGTRGNIENFDPAALGSSTNAGSAKQGFFFASDPSTAGDYASLAPSRKELGYRASLQRIVNERRSFLDEMAKKHGKDGPLKFGTNEKRITWQDKATPEELRVFNDLEKRYEDAIQNKPEFNPNELTDLELKLQTRELQPRLAESYKKNIEKLKGELANLRPEKGTGWRAQKEVLLDRIESNETALRWAEKDIATMDEWRKTERPELEKQIARLKEDNVAGENIVPAKLRMENPFIHDYEGKGYRDETYASILKKARDAGHDSVVLKNTYDPANSDNRVLQDIAVVFDPSQIRSKFAKFDPKKKNSGNILDSIAPLTVGGAAGAAALSSEDAEAARLPKKLPIKSVLKDGELAVKSKAGAAYGRDVIEDEFKYLLDEGSNKTISDQIEAPWINYLEHLEVNPELRGQGHGSDLLKKYLKEAKKTGAKEVVLNASPLGSMDREADLPKLIEFYKKHGFDVLDKSPHNAMMRKKLALMLGLPVAGAAALSSEDAEAAILKINPKALDVKNVDDLLKIALEKRLLHHATTKKNIESIAKIGLQPGRGEIVNQAYDDAIEWARQIEETGRASFDDVAFLSETPSGYFSKWQIEAERGKKAIGKKSPKKASLNDIEKHGGVGLFERNDDIYLADPQSAGGGEDAIIRKSTDLSKASYPSEVPPWVERGDYFTPARQDPDYIVTGKELREYLKKADPDFDVYAPQKKSTGKKALAPIAMGGAALGASQSWADDLQNPVSHGIGDTVSQGLETLDKYTGRPARAAVRGLIEKKNPFQEALDSVLQDRNVTGNDVAKSFFDANPQMMPPKELGGDGKHPLEDELGLAADVVLDPTNFVPVGAIKKAPKLLKTMRHLIP